MKSKMWAGIFSALGMLVVILDSKTALQGAKDGIELCVQSMIPSLFPFFVLSVLLTGSIAGLETKLFRPLGKLCGIPQGGEALFFIGLLGGYPTGAQAVAQSHNSGVLSRQDARRMLGFCSNAGPAFIFGILSAKFEDSLVPWVLWLIHIASATLTGAVLPGKSVLAVHEKSRDSISLSGALKKAVSICGCVCGWVVLFRILLTFFDRWFLWLVPEEIKIIIYGIFELANGCCQLEQITNPALRFVICACMLSFGGICVTMQTLSVTEGTGLGSYHPGKLIQLCFSLLLSLGVQSILFPDAGISAPILPIFAAIVGILIIFLRKREKNSSIPGAVGV